MTDINTQNSTSDTANRQASSHKDDAQNYGPSVQLPMQAAGTFVDPLTVGKQAKGKRRSKKAAFAQQEFAYADGQEQSDTGKGEEKASGGGGSSNLLYVVGGLAVVGAGVALAGGSGSSPAPEAPKDTTAPTAPAVSLAADTGSSSTDRITTNGRIDVGGLETGATWEYSTNGGTSWQAGSGKSFTLSAGTFADGAVLVRQKDAAGNVSATGKPAGAVTVDATAPAVATITQVAGDGTVTAAEKDAGITVGGTAEAGSSVSVVWGTVTKTTTALASGAWSVQYASAEVPADGATKARVTVTDVAGNASAVAEQTVTVDTRILVQGSIVAGPLVAGHGLTISLFSSAGTLIQSGIAVAADGSFSARVSANKGDVLIAKVIDSGTGSDYLDEATGATKDLNAALFAAVIVSDLSGPVQAQVNPVTTLAAMKAGLSADGSGIVKDAAAVRDANNLVAKALGLDDVSVVPVTTNGGKYAPNDGLSAGEKLGAALAALSGLDSMNAGDTQASLTFLAGQIGLSGQALSAEGLAAVINGAAAASPRTEGKLEAAVSDLLATAQQSPAVSINAVANDNIVSASELSGLVLTGTVGTGVASVALSVGSWTRAAVVTNGIWSYTLTGFDAAAVGAATVGVDGAKVLVATASLANGQTAASSRAILIDTTAPVATIDKILGKDSVNAADKLAGVVISGTAEAKSSIQVIWEGAKFSTQSDLAGRWTLTVPAAQVPTKGDTTVSVVATDINNNVGTAVTRNVAIDATLPSKPAINVVSQDDVLGAPEVASGISLTGTADPAAKVLLRWGSATEYSATANDRGEWTIPIPAAGIPAAGVRTITVQAEDAAGNLSTNATRDVTLYGALTAPVILPVMGDDVINVADSANGILLKGLAPSNALVRIVWGSTIVTAEADALGNWVAQFGLADLPADGAREIKATIVDASGTAFGSSSRPVNIDTTNPAAAGISAVAQNNIVNAAEKSAGIVVSGTAEAGSKVEVKWGGTSKPTNASASGAWTVTFAEGEVPKDGSTTVEVKTTDSVGNMSRISNLPITIDTGVPLTPTVSLVQDTGKSAADKITKNGSFGVVGVEPEASWSYSSDGGTNWEIGKGSTFLAADGQYEAGQIRVRQTDAAGNDSIAYSNTAPVVIDSIADNIEVDQVTDDDVVNLAEQTQGVTVTGTFEAGASVMVTWGTKVKTVSSVGADKKWSVTFLATEVPEDGSRAITVSAIDIAGNSTNITKTPITIDRVAPSALGIQLAVDTGLLNTDGITKEGIVNVRNLELGGDWEYSTNAGASWSRGSETSFELIEGVYEANTILVRQKDIAGNMSASSAITKKLVVDTSVVGLSISKVTDDDTVNIAEQAKGVTISGTAEANASVRVTWGAVVKTVNAGQDGVWSVDYLSTPVPVDGKYEIQAVQTDVAGNVEVGVARAVSVDTARPEAPQIAAVSTNDIVNGAEVKDGVSVSGTAVAKGRVEVKWGAISKKIDADDNGNWTILFNKSDIPVDGSTQITATVTNGIGNTSVASVPRSVLVDTIVAAPSIANVSNDGRVNAAEKSAGVTVSGLAEANAAVVVRWGTTDKPVSSNQDGKWSASFSSAEIPDVGDTSIFVSQTDAVGNKSVVGNAPVLIDTRAPLSPLISAIAGDDIVTLAEKNSGVVVSGRAEANAFVTATFGGRSETVTVDAAGNWSATFASTYVPTDSDQRIAVTVKDAAGNISAEGSRWITVATAQTSAPVIAVIAGDNVVGASEKAAGVRVSGLAVADSEVTVVWGGITQKINANAQGGWTTSFAPSDIPTNDGPYTVTATANGITSSRQILLDTTLPATSALTTAAALQGFDVATGSADAVIASADAADLMIGGNGSSIIRGGEGYDVLYGDGSGPAQGVDNDIFVWGSGDAGLGARDVIRDFTAWNGTSSYTPDLSALLSEYQAGTSDVSQWISLQNSVTLPGKTGALLTSDIDGLGASTVMQNTFLENASLATNNPNQLISGGVILA